MILELILAWLMTLPVLSEKDRKEFFRAELAIANAQLQCEACQAARVDRNRIIVRLQASCKNLSLEFNSAGEPACVLKNDRNK